MLLIFLKEHIKILHVRVESAHILKNDDRFIRVYMQLISFCDILMLKIIIA